MYVYIYISPVYFLFESMTTPSSRHFFSPTRIQHKAPSFASRWGTELFLTVQRVVLPRRHGGKGSFMKYCDLDM